MQYTIHVSRSDISDFTQTAYQDETYQTEHELQLIGLIPDETNEVMICIMTMYLMMTVIFWYSRPIPKEMLWKTV